MAPERYYRIAAAGRSRYLEIAVAVALLAPLAVLLVSSHHWGGVPRLAGAILLVAVVGTVFGMFRMHQRFAESALLRVHDDGMQLQSDVGGIFASTHLKPWSLAWKDVAQVAVLERLGLVQVRRRRFTAMPLAFRPLEWVPQDAPVEARAPRSFRESELWRDLESRGFLALAGAAKAQPADFDLMRHPATRAALFAMAIFAGYWLAESFLAREAWAEWNARYLAPHFAVAAAGAAVAFGLMRRAAAHDPVPGAVVAIMALFLGGTAGLASWSGLLRVNQFAGGPLVEERYVRNKDCDKLLPVKPELPPIEYTELARGYWCQFGKDHVHHVRIRKGLGGLYQVDLRPHTKAIREFRRGG